MIFPKSIFNEAIHSLDFDHLSAEQIHLNISDENNQNLTAAQKEYLLTHKKIAHANGRWCQELMSDGQFDYGDSTIETLPPVLPTQHKTKRSCYISRRLCAAYSLSKLEK